MKIYIMFPIKLNVICPEKGMHVIFHLIQNGFINVLIYRCICLLQSPLNHG